MVSTTTSSALGCARRERERAWLSVRVTYLRVTRLFSYSIIHTEQEISGRVFFFSKKKPSGRGLEISHDHSPEAL